MMGRNTVASIKRSRLVFGGVLGLVALFGMLALPAIAVEEEQYVAIAQNCPTIKQTLGQLQKADSRTRTYLGAAYETIQGKFITPLNLRLTRNNHEAEQLFNIQSEFMTEQSKFRERYTEYMRELEALIATDCSANPRDFYRRLETTRTKRSSLKATTAKLAELTDLQIQAVTDLKESL